jgi:hypothetical protein
MSVLVVIDAREPENFAQTDGAGSPPGRSFGAAGPAPARSAIRVALRVIPDAGALALANAAARLPRGVRARFAPNFGFPIQPKAALATESTGVRAPPAL